jgi:DNA-binding LacI/PurR family transcriptional regulator
VPRDISVAGFDDVPMATLSTPSLTTVSFPRIQMGRACVDILLDSILGRPTDSHAVADMPVELVVRESTGVAAALVNPLESRNPGLAEATA